MFHHQVTVCPPVERSYGFISVGIRDRRGRAVKMPVPFISFDSLFPVRPGPALQTGQAMPGGIWAGVLTSDFGHWLTETVPYLAACRDLLDRHPDLPLIGVTRPRRPVNWSSLHHRFAARVGVDLDKVRILSQPTRVERLLIPPDPFGARCRYREAAILGIDRIFALHPTRARRRVYYSRSALPDHQKRPTDGSEFDALFRARGWDIVYPEQIDLDEQIATAASADEIAGTSGSALHWALFAPSARRVISIGKRLQLQDGICRARGQVHLNFADSLLPRRLQSRRAIIRSTRVAAWLDDLPDLPAHEDSTQ